MNFSINFYEYMRVENRDNKNKNNESKYLQNMQNYQF